MNTLAIKMLKNHSKRVGIYTILALINWVLVCWLSIATLVQPVQAATVHWRTLVSLTFDDGLTESAARDILARHGMQGTFYINSNLIGSGGTYLTKAELDGLYADGNEIGGHTLGHVDLATLSDSAQRTALCNDMQNLVDWGYSVHSFAYPYGSSGPTTQSIMEAGCPAGTYESARTVGGLVSGTECYNCPFANTVPPANPYYILSNASFASTTTLEDLKGYVTKAESNGGGWVPLVFHRICDGCNTLAVSPSMLDDFLTWLETRESQYTYVRTVHEVMSGDYPPPPPPPQLGPNLLLNPSLELDANNNNQADCWERDGYGSNSATWTRINDTAQAHTGNFAEQLIITTYSSGDRKLLPSLDGGQPGACAPTVVAGQLYELSAWYKSTVPSAMVLFYLDANGQWQYWRDGAELPASANWTQTIQYTGTLPAGAQAISFGITLTGIGTLTTDDYSMAQVLESPPPDTAPPLIAGFAPAEGATVSGSVTLSADATDNLAMQRVEFLINGEIVATATSAPYSGSWDSTTIANGPVTYAVRAIDTTGNSAVSGNHALSVLNDYVPPVINDFAPAEGATVSGNVTLSADATDNLAMQRVEFLINGEIVATATTVPYSGSWDSTAVANGLVSYSVRAVDTVGNSAVSGNHVLSVLNDIVPPVINDFAPAEGATVSGNVTLSADATDNLAMQRVEFLINGEIVATATTVPYSGSWDSTTIANGPVTYAVRAIDTAGNSAVSGNHALSVLNDNVPPVINDFAPAEGATVSGNVTLSADTTDNLAMQRVEFLINGEIVATATSAPYSGSWDSTTIANGPVTYAVRAIDTTGNSAVSGNHALSVLNDSVPPVINDFAPTEGSTVSGSVILSADATDNLAMKRVEFLINGEIVATATSAPYSGSWDSTIIANGPVTYFVLAVDAAGNATIAGNHALSVLNDSLPPVINDFAPAEGSTVSGNVTLSADATDNLAMQRVEFLINGEIVATATSAPYSGSWDSTAVVNGPVTYEVRAFDALGNSIATSITNITVNNLTTNLLTNPSLEIDANNDGLADCWQRTGYGTNTSIWTRVSGNAHSGNYAESIQVTNLTSGDRKLVPNLDSSTCAPTVTSGARYILSGWYKSTTPTAIVVYYRSSTGVWQYWKSSTFSAASSSWKQASYTTPPIPTGATTISFGLILNDVGTLITDDYAVTQLLDGTSSDTIPPVIVNFKPTDGATVSGTVTLTADATDNVAMQRVEFLINDAVVATATSAPYTGSWNSTMVVNGPVTYAVRAFDAVGNSTATPIANITVNNLTTNLLTNPSLEIDANNDGLADCWQRTGYGTNTFIWTRVSGNAHSGNYAESIQVTNLTSGDRKLLPNLDSSACAPAVNVGARYTLSGWYKSTLATEIVVFYRTSAGAWQYWKSSTFSAASSSWKQASYTTPPIPSGATAISFGFALSGVGTLITDDYSMLITQP